MTHNLPFILLGIGWLSRRQAEMISRAFGVLILSVQTAQAASPDLLEHFEQRIRPILIWANDLRTRPI